MPSLLTLLCSYKLVALLYDVVPDILIQTGKVKNPCEWQQLLLHLNED